MPLVGVRAVQVDAAGRPAGGAPMTLEEAKETLRLAFPESHTVQREALKEVLRALEIELNISNVQRERIASLEARVKAARTWCRLNDVNTALKMLDGRRSFR